VRRDGVVIAGGGLAAERACQALRRRGYDGRIQMVCGERTPPYDRPPLSKQLLAGRTEIADLAYRPDRWYADNGVDLLLDTRARTLDTATRRLSVSGGAALRYDALLIATGARPRRLARLDGYANVSVLRSVDEALRLRSALRAGTRLAIVGAGFIGQEVAATARGLGVDVTIVERQQAPLASELGPRIAHWFCKLHRAEGVRLMLGDTVTAARGRERVEELVLGSGRRLECDHVLVAVGTEPELEFIAGAGLDRRGVSVDASGWTGVPHVYAAGDVAAPYESALGRRRRTEHWEAAARQGVAAAMAILRVPGPGRAVASCWSDQYGVRIHYVGYASAADDLTIAGDPAERRFTALFRRNGHVVAALLVDMSKRLRETRSAVEAGLRRLDRTRGAPCPT